LLSDVFADALREHAPRSLAVLGCAGGSGFDRIAPRVTKRVVAVDINPHYVRELRRRFEDRIPGLDAIVGDVQAAERGFAPVEMVFAGLLFEYVDPETVLARIRAMLVPGGALVTVLQLPSAAVPEVTLSPFTSLEALSTVVRLVPPSLLERLATARGLERAESRRVESAGGKEFQIQTFRRAEEVA
jgi:phospholipid N-methyltransferase